MKNAAKLSLAFMALFSPLSASAFVSLSTGADGAFNPTVSQELPLPPDGIFNFTDVNIPAGVTITFTPNAANTPVRIFATGDVTIDGTINVDGKIGGSPGGGAPGLAGPGGFGGGRGGLPARHGQPDGGDGLGPGRGLGAVGGNNPGSGGSFGTTGSGSTGPVYGNAELLPLIGGSGGGGAGGGTNNVGGGGGGGAGAILISASGTVTVNGTVSAVGGSARVIQFVAQAGAGSGGAIRIMATAIRGEGTITALGSTTGTSGGNGRIRLETENLERTSNTTPTFVYSLPGVQLVPNLPSIRIASVAGIAAPGNPTGSKDIVIPGVTTNPVPVVVETTNVPAGTVITVIAAPERGTAVTANTGGVDAAGNATANVNLPNGNSVLSAQTTFTVTASLGDALKNFAEGERVERIELAAANGGASTTTLITVTGRRFTWPSNVVAFN